MLSRIQGAEAIYRANLSDRRVLFVTNDSLPPLEVSFRDRNFMHLCGVDYPIGTPSLFLDLACARKLDADLIVPRYEEKTPAKLEVLQSLMYVDSQANMIVENPDLPGRTKADCIAIKNDAVMGFVESGALHVPNTVLKISRRWTGPRMVVAVVKTERRSETYSKVTKKPKGLHPDQTRIRHILTALEKYGGTGDVNPVIDYFGSMLESTSTLSE